MTETSEPTNRKTLDRARGAALWLRDSGLGGVGFSMVLAVALSGWTASFIGLHDFGVHHMGYTERAAWLVPLTFDGAPAGLTIVVMRAGVHGRSAITWRILIVAFTLLSSWINYEHISDPLGRIVACLMPPSAVIVFEGLMSEVRAAAARRAGVVQRPRLHLLRWVFDFRGTLEIVRLYVLGLPLPDALAVALVAPQQETARRPGKEAQSAPATAMTPAPKAPQVPTQGAMADPAGRPEETPQGAPADAPKAPSKRPVKAPSGRSKVDVRGAARDAIKALYAETGKRPKESDMIAALKAQKLPHSRQFANARRLEVERDEPHLAAFGSDNVRTLTG